MGREVKRVPLDFNWPIGKIWPPYMTSLCMEEVRYAIHAPEEKNSEVVCEACRHAGQLAGVPMLRHGCPSWKIDPPKGDGWQLWETITEGSPVSPVFATPEELAYWLVQPGNDTSITKGMSENDWLVFLTKHGWSPSIVVSQYGVTSGANAMAHKPSVQ